MVAHFPMQPVGWKLNSMPFVVVMSKSVASKRSYMTFENAYDLKVSKTWKRRLKEKMRELNDTEAAIAKVLDGADESDADVAGDSEPEPDAPLRPGEDGSVASLEIAAPDDDDSDDDDSPADASPGCLAGVPIATNNATAGLAAPAPAPTPAFTLSPRLVELQLPPAMQEILQQRLQANKQGINLKRRLEVQASREALGREPPGVLRLQHCSLAPRARVGMVVSCRADAELLSNEYLEHHSALRKRYE